jgi:hypothetical protein
MLAHWAASSNAPRPILNMEPCVYWYGQCNRYRRATDTSAINRVKYGAQTLSYAWVRKHLFRVCNWKSIDLVRVPDLVGGTTCISFFMLIMFIISSRIRVLFLLSQIWRAYLQASGKANAPKFVYIVVTLLQRVQWQRKPHSGAERTHFSEIAAVTADSRRSH